SRATSVSESGTNIVERELLALLLEEEGVELLGAKPIAARPDASTAPLSFAQQRLWFIDQLLPDSPAYNIPVVTVIGGSLNQATLEQDLTEITRRHQVRRSRFQTVDFKPIQVVRPLEPVRMAVVDLTDITGPALEHVRNALFGEEARRPFKLADGPLVRACI